MKRIFLLAVVGACLIFARPVRADDLAFPKFQSDITINKDASIQVVETITADFGTAHHGIYRSIPFNFSTLDGGQASIPINITAITQDGQPAKFTLSNDSINIVAKVGDPGVTITGQHVYTISYTAQAAANFFSDHDELYWNVTGSTWDAPLQNVTANVHFASDVVDATGNGPIVNQTACYTGYFGSTATDCQHAADKSTATFSSNDYLTIVVGWPTGFLTKPENFDSLRAQGSAVSSSSQTASPSWMVTGFFALFLLFVVVIFMMGRSKLNGPKDRRPIIPQYEPPKDVRPGEASVLVSTAGESVVISASIVDLAVRGYLRIEEKEDSVFLGLGHTKSFDLVEVKKPDDSLRPYEKQLLDAIFRQPKYPAEGGRISLSTFKNHRTSTYEAFEDVTTMIEGVGLERGWFTHGQGLMSLFEAMTPAGKDMLWYLRGFRLYLKTAEQYRLQWQEKEHIFETFLPYAMVLGVAHAWSKALAPLMTKPPDWYRGDFSNGFNTVVFYTAISGLSSQVMASAVSGAASSSSGFSGGSSGGGGGGGGGGGW